MMTDLSNVEGCVQRIHQLERTLCELKEEYDERLRVLKDESDERLRVQKEEHEKALLAQQDVAAKTYCNGCYPLPLEDFPLEIIALIADFVYHADHKYAHLGAMMLVSHRLRDGVSLSEAWRVVNEVVTHVDDVAERRKILLSRWKSVKYASSRCEDPHPLRYLRLSCDEALKCLYPACRAGRLECVRYLVETFEIEACVDNSYDFLRAAFRHQHLHVVQYLHPAIRLTANHARAGDNQILQWACKAGHLPEVQYLHTAFGLTADDARAHYNQALRSACHYGFLPVVQYLHTAFGLTADDARGAGNKALLGASANGHLPVVQYLHTAFGLTADDIRTIDNYALRLACQSGHLPVVQYLHTSFGLTMDDARAMDNDAFQGACESGNLPLVQYLHTGFGLTADDARANDNSALQGACEFGHIPVIQYLHTAFGLMTGFSWDDWLAHQCITTAAAHGFEDVVRYLLASLNK